MRNMLKVLMIAAVAMFATGCANQAAQDYYLAMNAAAQANAAQAEHRYKALATVAANASASGDQASAVAAAMAIAMTQNNTVVPQYVESSALKWASIIVPSVANLGGLAIQAGVSKNASDNARDVQLATQQTYATMQQSSNESSQAIVTGLLNGQSASAQLNTEALVTLGTEGFNALNTAGQQTVGLGQSGLDTIEAISSGNNALINNLSTINAGTNDSLIGVIDTFANTTDTDTIVCSPDINGAIVCGASSN